MPLRTIHYTSFVGVTKKLVWDDEFRVPEAARVLGVSPERVSVFVKEGRLAARQNQEGWWKIGRETLREFMKVNRYVGRPLKSES